MRDMISVASGFQYSVNIGYDLGCDDKLRNFIPTKSALSLLEEILLSINPASTDRARVLIGALLFQPDDVSSFSPLNLGLAENHQCLPCNSVIITADH